MQQTPGRMNQQLLGSSTSSHCPDVGPCEAGCPACLRLAQEAPGKAYVHCLEHGRGATHYFLGPRTQTNTWCLPGSYLAATWFLPGAYLVSFGS